MRETLQLLGAAVVLVAVVALGVTQVPRWWRGTSEVSLARPPDGWLWGAGSWRRLARAAPVSLVCFGAGAAGLLLEPLDARVAGAAFAVAAAAVPVWLSTALLARPRTLIPPPWRPGNEGHGLNP